MSESHSSVVIDSPGQIPDLHQDLFALRTRLGLTQEELAYTAGYTPPHISNLEHGRKGEVNSRTVFALAQALKVFPVEVAAALATTMELAGWERVVAIAQFDPRRITHPGGADLRTLVTTNGCGTWSEVVHRTGLAPGELLAIRHRHDLTLGMVEKVASGLGLNYAQAFHAAISTRDDVKMPSRNHQHLWVLEYATHLEMEGLL